LGLPRGIERSGDVASVVLFGVDVNFDEFDGGLAEVVFDPIGFAQHFGICVSCHRFLVSYAVVPAARPGMCLIMFEVYLKILSGKIITPNPFLSRIIISTALPKSTPNSARPAALRSCKVRARVCRPVESPLLKCLQLF